MSDVLKQVELLEKEVPQKLASISDLDHCEKTRIELIGKRGVVTSVLKSLRDLHPDERRVVGQKINVLKKDIESSLLDLKKKLEEEQRKQDSFIDYTLPGRCHEFGTRHPINQTIDEISEIFHKIGFQVVEGREVEEERYNFTVLNIPEDHPARDGFDTFYTEDGKLLRSQTSTVQGRIMEKYEPPLAIIAPGKVYRPDTVDATHSFMFHQMEGFWVDQDIKFSDLKGVLHYFAKEYFGKKTKIRFRPHFFPFTEPSVEVDITCFKCGGKGCTVCSHSGWIEILGAGSIHPQVFEEVGYDPKKFRGFAFGLGIERICMLKHNIFDIRYFYENNIKFLNQF